MRSLKQVLLAIAAIGGHIKYNGDPGWLTLSRGYTHLLLLTAGWQAAKLQQARDQSRAVLGAAARIEEVIAIVIVLVIVNAVFGGRDGGRAPSGRDFVNHLRRGSGRASGDTLTLGLLGGG